MTNKPSQAQPIKSSNFLITIHHTDNYGYQGLIQWLDTGEKIHFRSELELMMLIHSAVSCHTAEDSPLRNWGQTENISVS
ncbi:hypothetical protein [Petrocella sp. FN5]|uniref:hypothetical protein n=1 Tax=Petrocella sp. FN5 TaxID=3032002 RepID=UPI0023DAAAA6|nr:hypothetical protein [Petrocella sp. FN5]MDF1616624.1 hypothetical protein [Petrocella sp. FN5]